MYCPMKFNNQKAHEDQSYCICDKSSCAWWTHGEDQGYCAITRLAINIDDLHGLIKCKGLNVNNRY